MRAIFLALLFLPLLCSAKVNTNNPKIADERLVLDTNFGNMVFVLYPEIAPKHVSQVLKLARLGIYDGINIYRVEKGFVAQISNEFDREIPLDETQKAAVAKIPAEFSQLRHERGVLSMARFDDPNSAEVSFSILLGDAPHLDGQYTIFGRLEQGFDVLEQIEKTPVNANNVPETKITVMHAEVLLQKDVASYLQAHAGSAPDAAEAKVKILTQTNILATFFMAAIALLAFIALLLKPASTRPRAAIMNLILLTAGLGVLTLSTPLIRTHYQYIGAILFFGLVAIFKMLGRFDAPE
jgi:cyclophilin family peptidyl-prolyl cis-trans isomerase